MTALRGDAAPPSRVSAVHGRTDGNPFFVDGIVRLLGTDGQPVMGVAHWSTSGSLVNLRLAGAVLGGFSPVEGERFLAP
jgi:hypothetical protein